MKQVFILFRTENGKKEIKNVYSQKDEQKGNDTLQILKDNLSSTDVTFSLEAFPLFEGAKKKSKGSGAAKSSIANRNGRMNVATTKDIAL